MEEVKKILIIDDEPDFVEAFTRTLEARRYRVISASTTGEGQEMMKQAPDVVVLGTITPAREPFKVING